MTRLKVFAAIALLFALSLSAYAGDANDKEKAKGSFYGTIGTINTKSNFFEGQSGKKFSFGFRLAVNPWHEKKSFLNRLSVEPSFLFAPIHSEKFGNFQLRERLYQPGVDLGFKVLNTKRFDVIGYSGTAFSRDSFTIAERNAYGQWTNICQYLQEGICRGKWNILGRSGGRFLYHPKKDSKFFIGLDANTRKQYLFVIGTEF